MAGRRQLDAARRARNKRVIALFALFLGLFGPQNVPVRAQQKTSFDESRLAAARAAFEASNWQEAARLAQGPSDQSADLDFLAGLALSRLERWDGAKRAFLAGHIKSPKDPRFLIELAGVAYKQKNLSTAKRSLRAALRIAPDDSYALEFLGTLYFLDGNLDAALKYWNAVKKPRLQSVDFSPAPKLQSELLARAITFNAPQILTGDALANTKARLDNLEIFPRQRVQLSESQNSEYDATLSLDERDGLGDSKIEGIVSLLSGLPYGTVYPELYDLGHGAVNFTSLARWDPEKRRYGGDLSAPLFHDPALRMKAYFDSRDENWNLTRTFFGTDAPVTDLNMRRVAGGVELHSVVSGRWSWSTGLEFVHRSFRNLEGSSSAAELPVFTDGNSFAYWLGAERALLRIPEHRFSLDSSVEARAGRSFNEALGPFATARGGLHAKWFPRASGDDYEMQTQIRAGATAGRVPFDELFELGLERDNDLWLRGEPGTIDGRKGAAPLGRRYFLTNWEMDKIFYRGAFFNVKLGPFLDNGAVADSSGLFGSQRWLWDSGGQCKIQILGAVTVVLSYGRDLRGDRGVFYGTVLR